MRNQTPLVPGEPAVADEYRKQAERCRVRAENSSQNADRAFWLLLAQDWPTLAQDMEAEPPEALHEVNLAP
jgi:hypothetical protein